VTPPATEVGPAAWASGFSMFSASHALALAWTLPLIVGSCWLGRRWRDRARRGLDPAGAAKEARFAWGWGLAVVVINVLSLVYWLAPPRYDVAVSLPLQLCDLAAMNAALVYLSAWRVPRALAYFWGLGLSTQAFVTPTLTEGPDTARYWLFWLVHVAIVGSAVYDVVVRRYRPGRRDFVLATAVSVAWVAGVFGLNLWLGTNYGYVGRPSGEARTFMDVLGPWPWRVLAAGVVGVSLFAGMWAVWRVLPARWSRPLDAAG
jgi:hypothetical integral membrane protein (TIGR02206 family)